MDHRTDIDGYDLTDATVRQRFVTQLGDLRYDVLTLVLQDLNLKMARDAEADQRRGRKNLAAALVVAHDGLRIATVAITEAWRISRRHMGL